MENPIAPITTEQDFQRFTAVLKSSNLSSDDLRIDRDLLIAYHEDGELVGTGALEIYGSFGLLRSLSVKLGTRGKALGTALTTYLIDEARNRGLSAIFLLTENARGFFERKGFIDVEVDAIPATLRASSEFSRERAKPASAMMLSLA